MLMIQQSLTEWQGMLGYLFWLKTSIFFAFLSSFIWLSFINLLWDAIWRTSAVTTFHWRDIYCGSRLEIPIFGKYSRLKNFQVRSKPNLVNNRSLWWIMMEKMGKCCTRYACRVLSRNIFRSADAVSLLYWVWSENKKYKQEEWSNISRSFLGISDSINKSKS